MPRRIEIELTSAREDGSWTWRAAGAKAPKGTVEASILPPAAKVGDVLRAEADFFVDGIQVTSIVPPKAARQEPERIELIAPTKPDEPLVTTTLAPRGRDDRGPRRDGPRRDGPRREGARRDGGRPGDGGRRGGARPEGGGPEGARADRGDAKGAAAGRGDRAPRGEGEQGRRREGGDRPPRRNRPEPPPMPAIERPKAKRLRPGRAHRNALLEALPEEQRRIAEQVVLGGLPAVRQAIEKQNAERTAAGETAIAAGPLLDLAEKLVPRVRAAEWRDRAEAALRDLEHLDLRDLRSVVSAADARTKDPEARALAEQLQAGLVSRVDAEHHAWLEELTATLDVGRIVRALRVSSRPPKAGSPLPPELSTRLTTMAGEALTADAAPERWVAVLDALAFAPVRDKVIPTSLPKDLHADVRGTIARLATRIPKVAHIFEIEPDPTAPRPKPERRRPPKPKKPKSEHAKPDKSDKGDKRDKGDKPKGDKPKPETPPKADEPKVDDLRADAEAPEQTTANEPKADAEAPEQTTADEPKADAEAPEQTTADEPKADAEAPEQTTADEPEAEAEVAQPSADASPEPEAIEAEPEGAPAEAEPAVAPATAEPTDVSEHDDAEPAPPAKQDVWLADSSLEPRPAETREPEAAEPAPDGQPDDDDASSAGVSDPRQ